MTPQGPDWDAFDQSPLTVDRRQAAERAVIEAARAAIRELDDMDDPEVNWFHEEQPWEVVLRTALHKLDAVGTPDEVNP